jgi:hypothetical protein
MKSIPADAELVLVCRPKGLSGISGSSVADTLAGGGRYFAPKPPEGFGYEPGHVDEVVYVQRGPLKYKIIRFIWKARPDRTTQLITTHRGMSIYKDVLKTTQGEKTRTVVVMGSDVMLMENAEDAKAAIDRMLDAKGVAFPLPNRAPAAYISTKAPPLEKILCDGMGPKLPQPKVVHAVADLPDNNYSVNYTFEYESPEAAAAAKETIEKARKEVILEIGRIKEKESHKWEVGANPYSALETWLHETIEVSGSQLKMSKSFSKMPMLMSQRLVNLALNLGEGEVLAEQGNELVPGLPGF